MEVDRADIVYYLWCNLCRSLCSYHSNMGSAKTAHARKPAAERNTGSRKSTRAATQNSRKDLPSSGSPEHARPKPRPRPKRSTNVEVAETLSNSEKQPEVEVIAKNRDEEQQREDRISRWVDSEWDRFKHHLDDGQDGDASLF